MCTDLYFSLFQVAQKRGVKTPSCLDPEVLSVFVPPFTSKEDSQVSSASCTTLGKGRRRSFRKRREKPRMEPWRGLSGDPKGPDSEDVSILGDVDLLALPQLCFPGMVHMVALCWLNTEWPVPRGSHAGDSWPWLSLVWVMGRAVFLVWGS
jgi:hypothetical protein